jgi:hypothetical protein
MEMGDADDWWQSLTELQCFGDAGAAHACCTIGHIFKCVPLNVTNEADYILWYVALRKAGNQADIIKPWRKVVFGGGSNIRFCAPG